MHLGLWRQIFVNEGLASVYIPRFPGITVHVKRHMDFNGLRLSPTSATGAQKRFF